MIINNYRTINIQKRRSLSRNVIKNQQKSVQNCFSMKQKLSNIKTQNHLLNIQINSLNKSYAEREDGNYFCTIRRFSNETTN